MSTAPGERWGVLMGGVDWQSFFRSAPKTHRELRWWYCLAAANRRVFLLHAFTFVVLAILAYPTDDASEVSDFFNGWGATRALPLLFQLAPLSNCIGRTFEWWSAPSSRRQIAFVRAWLAFACTMAAAVCLVIAQGRLSPAELEVGSIEWLDLALPPPIPF
jgi:hypothetical protein